MLERLFDYNIGGILLCYIIALHIKLPRARSFKPCISCKQSSWVDIVTKPFSLLWTGSPFQGGNYGGGENWEETAWEKMEKGGGGNGGDRGVASCMYETRVRT